MIDLRSDTLSMPDTDMLSKILTAPLGDSGRLDEDGRGGDPSVNALEDLAAAITGKERALFFPSGTMGNHAALLTHCHAGEFVLIDTMQHMYRTEKAAFSSDFGQLRPLFYHLTKEGYPDTKEIRQILKTERHRLLCIENTHNWAGGTCIPLPVLQELRILADEAGIPIHMDGARLFNAEAATGLSAETICSYADSVMFCISKGLGAPVGSLLVGSKDFILRAAAVRKLLGGNMRQAGILAAAGQYALMHNREDLREDHRRACLALDALKGLKKIRIPDRIQSNIIILDLEAAGLSAEQFVQEMKSHGVWLSVSSETHARMVFYRNITDSQALEAAAAIRKYDETL